MNPDVRALEDAGIRASAHRVAVAAYVLHTHDHPSADRVWERVQRDFPRISRATVYNTLATFVERGLLVRLELGTDHAVYDCNLERHHHFVDDATGAVTDLPWHAVAVKLKEAPAGASITGVSVIVRGTTRRPRR